MLTKTGVGFAGLSCLLYVASMQAATGLLFLVLGIVVACLLANAIEARRSAAAMDIIPPPSFCGTEGQRADASWWVRNRTSRTCGLARVSGELGTLLQVGRLAPGEKAAVTPGLGLPRRGVYRYSDLKLVSTYPFGLVRAGRGLRLQGELVVYPAVYECEAPRASGFGPMLGGGFTGPFRAVVGDRFHGVRPLQDTDPVKLVHWPSSSKGQGLMVKEFDEELSGRVALLLDTRSRAAPDGGSLLDWSARAAGSLALAALYRGHQVELADLLTGEVSAFPPFADPEAVLAVLARLQESPEHLSEDVVERVVPRLSSRSSLCFVLSRIEPWFPPFVRDSRTCRRRVVSLYVPELERTPERLDGLDSHTYGPHCIDGLEPS